MKTLVATGFSAVEKEMLRKYIEAAIPDVEVSFIAPQKQLLTPPPAQTGHFASTFNAQEFSAKGFRYLGADEVISNGDQYFSLTTGKWLQTNNAGSTPRQSVAGRTNVGAYRRKL